jgi:hypothetical protein
MGFCPIHNSGHTDLRQLYSGLTQNNENRYQIMQKARHRY